VFVEQVARAEVGQWHNFLVGVSGVVAHNGCAKEIYNKLGITINDDLAKSLDIFLVESGRIYAKGINALKDVPSDYKKFFEGLKENVKSYNSNYYLVKTDIKDVVKYVKKYTNDEIANWLTPTRKGNFALTDGGIVDDIAGFPARAFTEVETFQMGIKGFFGLSLDDMPFNAFLQEIEDVSNGVKNTATHSGCTISRTSNTYSTIEYVRNGISLRIRFLNKNGTGRLPTKGQGETTFNFEVRPSSFTSWSYLEDAKSTANYLNIHVNIIQ
jgi:hypothetical protein